MSETGELAQPLRVKHNLIVLQLSRELLNSIESPWYDLERALNVSICVLTSLSECEKEAVYSTVRWFKPTVVYNFLL